MLRQLSGHRKISSRALLLLSLTVTFVLGLGSLFPLQPAKAESTSAAASSKPGWVLTFADEFDDSTLDATKWVPHYWWGRTNAGNNELEYYADDAFEFTNGAVRMRADRRSMGGFEYTSGLIASHDSFSQLYGYFEIRAKMPAGQALWPSFWLLPSLQSGLIWPPEIDIFEFDGSKPNTASENLHYGADPEHHQQTLPPLVEGPDFTADFHTFAIDWQPNLIIWYVDGIERNRTEVGVPSVPMYLIANLAIGGDYLGPPSSSTPFPSYFDVDYIRVYQKAPPGPSIAEVSPNRGLTSNATLVSIKGSNFKAGAKVTFDATYCDQAAVVSDTLITCTAPPPPKPMVDVTVVNPDGQSATLSRGFVYAGTATHKLYLPLVQ